LVFAAVLNFPAKIIFLPGLGAETILPQQAIQCLPFSGGRKLFDLGSYSSRSDFLLAKNLHLWFRSLPFLRVLLTNINSA
jgi:hypothetical protein